ncbi:MAG: DMT family transporter [Pseudomonadota bacterium]|nr:DMT family transporter [Pseudomonadota bacterium]
MHPLSFAPNQRALIFAVAAVGLWSTMATAFKWALEFSTPMALITVATTVSWCFFSVRIFLAGRLQSLLEMRRGLVLRCLLLGLLNPAFYYWVLFTAYDLLPAQDAMAINYTWGLTLPLVAAFFSRTLPRKHEAGLAILSYLGILVIATSGNFVSLEFDRPLGVALALFSTVIWGLSWVINSRVTDANGINPELALFLNFSAALPVLWIAIGISGQLPNVSMGFLLSGLYIGFFEMGIAFVLWMNAMRLTDNPLRISSLIFLAPPLSLLLIGKVLNEPISHSTLIGLAIILIGLAGQQWLDRTR